MDLLPRATWQGWIWERVNSNAVGRHGFIPKGSDDRGGFGKGEHLDCGGPWICFQGQLTWQGWIWERVDSRAAGAMALFPRAAMTGMDFGKVNIRASGGHRVAAKGRDGRDGFGKG